MKNRNLPATVIFVLLFIVVASLSFGNDGTQPSSTTGGNVSMLQRIKNAYNDFKNRREQGAQGVKAEVKHAPMPVKEEPKMPIAQKAEVQKAEARKVEAPKANTAKKAMTREGKIAELTEDFASTDELFSVVQGLKAEKDKLGKVSYTFKGMKVENLSEEDMDKLLTQVKQALVKIRSDRITKQLETVKQAQRIHDMTRSAPISISTPAQPPRTPPSTPPTVNIPKAPPQLPPRR